MGRELATGTAVGPSPPTAGPRESRLLRWRPRRADVVAATVCVVVGVMMAVLPHLVWWPRVGAPVWIADSDDVVYLQIGAQAYEHHPACLGDPVVTAGSRSAYSSLALAPGVLAAYALGTGPLSIGLFWRAFSGIAVGLLSYVLLRHFIRQPVVAAAAACILLSDSGMITSHLLVKQWQLVARVLTGRVGDLFGSLPRLHPEWRIVNPGPTLPFLLFHVWTLARARARPTLDRLALSGLAFGLLFSVYFYYYTAACVALGLALVLDSGHRKVYAHTLWIGGLVGLPALLSALSFSHSTPADWLLRTDKFLPIPRFSRLFFPRAAILGLAVGLPWAWLKRRDLLYLALLALAGFGLSNHQVVTGLMIENFHWVYVWGPMTSWLLVLIVAGAGAGAEGHRMPFAGRFAAVLPALALAHLGAGLWLRGIEATRTRESVALVNDYLRYRTDRRAAGGIALVPGTVVAGEPTFVDFAAILDDQRPLSGYAAQVSPYVDDASWNDRGALNAYLLGQSAADFEAAQRTALERGWGPWPNDPARRAAMLSARMAAFRRVQHDPQAELARFRVRTIATPARSRLPAALSDDWTAIARGASWTVWTSAVSAARPGTPRQPGTPAEPVRATPILVP
jgi:hypothetical protein